MSPGKTRSEEKDMALHRTPEDHDADPPAKWQVVKVADRCWRLVSSLNDETVFEYCTTRKAAEAARAGSHTARLYEQEGRWFRGEAAGRRRREERHAAAGA